MLPKSGMTKMIKKAQELQSQMEKAQAELNSIEIEGQAGGGMVTVTRTVKSFLSCKFKIFSSLLLTAI